MISDISGIETVLSMLLRLDGVGGFWFGILDAVQRSKNETPRNIILPRKHLAALSSRGASQFDY